MSKDTIKQLENAINVVNAVIGVTNLFLDKKSWRYKRNEMTRIEVMNCLNKQILKLKEGDNKG